MKLIKKSKKLNNVLYDIRGPIVDRAKEMEAQGQQLIKLNIGNLASFDFQVPEEIQRDMILNLPNSAGYSDSKGIFAARKAVMHYTQELGIRGVTLDDIYLGNGASDLISLATNALLDEGDELLIPMPDYPLWTATTSLSGGTPVHYLCDEENGWQPDLDDIRAKITPRTRGIVIINPNNPTGAVYPKETLLKLVDIAREFGLIIFADEVYDKILYEDAKHIAIASLSTDVLTITFNSLSKAYRACGYRAGWMIISGNKLPARDFIEGLNMLANMKLCANVPGQSRPRSAATSRSTTSSARAAACAFSATSPGSSSRRFRASPASSPRARSTCSRGSIRRSTRSRTTASSSRSSLKPRASCSCRARASTGRIPITSASCSCRTSPSCARPSAALPNTSPPGAPHIP